MKEGALAGVILAMIMTGTAATLAAGQALNGSAPNSTTALTLPGLQSSAAQYTTVTGRTTFTYNGSLPAVHIVSLEVDPASCTAYRFTVNATGGNPPYTISWFFGDNSTGGQAAENVTMVLHEYAAPGDYILIVRVHDTPVTSHGPYYEDLKVVTVVDPASECGTQGYVAVVLLLGVSAAAVFAGVVAFRRRRMAA